MEQSDSARSAGAPDSHRHVCSSSSHTNVHNTNDHLPGHSVAKTRASGHRPIRIAVLASLYPNSQQPRHGIFVEQRLRSLVASGEVEAQVVAPVPWFGSQHPRYGNYARLAAIPAQETRHGLTIHHPRYVVIPKIGMIFAPVTMAWAVIRGLKQLLASGFDFDLIDAHYLYPDGVAAARVARRLSRPFVMTARGTDVNTIAGMRMPGGQIRRAARRAERVITVSEALRRTLTDRGVPSANIETLRNGVDLDLFAPRDREAVRRELGISDRFVWLCAGHLTQNKGVHIALEALSSVSDAVLLIIGDGPERGVLVAEAARLGVTERVFFLGTLEHPQLPAYYSAADVLILASGSEGMPNVVLEALACGTAVLATAVGGVPEIIDGPPAGKLLEQRSVAELLKAWRGLPPQLLSLDARRQRRRHAENFGWHVTTRGQIALFKEVLGTRRG